MKKSFTRRTTTEATAIITFLVAIAELILPRYLLAQTNDYTVVELSAIIGRGQIVSGMNNLGDVVGKGAGNSAAIWNHGAYMRKRFAPFANGDFSFASAINDTGQIAGASNTGASIIPVTGSARAGLQSLPLLAKDNGGQAFGINKKGNVVGYSSGPNGIRAFLWSRSAGTRDLGCLPGGTSSSARAINDSNQIVGKSDSSSGEHAVLWASNGAILDLGTLPGDIASEATAINNGGDVVGYSKGSSGVSAFIWSAASGMRDLGVLPGGDSSRALDINDSGQIVGTSETSSGDHAFIWTNQTGMMDLNNSISAGSGVVLVEAQAINSSGQILAMGKLQTDGAPAHDDCAPAPPKSFLLAPASTQVTAIPPPKKKHGHRQTKP